MKTLQNIYLRTQALEAGVLQKNTMVKNGFGILERRGDWLIEKLHKIIS